MPDETTNRSPEVQAASPPTSKDAGPVVAGAAPSTNEVPAFDCVTEAHTPSRDEGIPKPAPENLSLPELPGYRVMGELGRGGMGVVYDAVQISLGRRVAIKLLPAGVFRDPMRRKRFEREAKAAAKLHHTNIVPVHGFGEHEGTPYYVMQLIPGLGLDAVIEELARQPESTRTSGGSRGSHGERARGVALAHSLLNPKSPNASQQTNPTALFQSSVASSLLSTSSFGKSLSASGIHLPGQDRSEAGILVNKSTYWHSVARIGTQVAGALAYAHKLGVLHRDIKPANLLLDLDGIVWVTDFGLAKADDSDNLTQTGDVMGTLRYMPPEAFEGKSEARSDIYALGLTLFELIALRPAYQQGDKNKLVKQVSAGETPQLRKLRQDAPRDLVTIVEKAIEREPGRRYQSAKALGDDLQRFLEGRPILARRATELERLWMWAKRHPAMAGMIAAFFLCLVAGAITSTVFAIRAAGFAREASERERDATNARRAMSRTLADSYVTLGQIAGDRGDAALAALWYAKAAAQTEGEGDRDLINRIRVRNWSAEGILTPVAAVDLPELVQRLEFHPSGRYLTGRTVKAECTIWDLQTSTVWQVPRSIERLTAVAWNRAGTQVVLGGQDKAALFAFPSGETIRTWDWAGPVTAVAFSPDGSKLVLGGLDVQVWDLKLDRSVSPRWTVSRPPHAIVFTPDGSRVALAGGDQVMRVFAVNGNRTEPAFTSPNQLNCPPQFLHGGSVVLTYPTETTAVGVDVATGKAKFRLNVRGNNGWEFKLATSPDGKRIWGQDLQGNRVVEADDTGAPIASGFPHLNMIFSLAPNPAGSLLASGAWDRTLRVWDVKTRTLRFPEMTSVSSPVVVAWSPDGQHLAAAYEGRSLRVWALPPGPPIRSIEPGGAISMARFASDGQSILPHSGTNVRASQRQFRLFDPVTGKPVSALVNAGGVLLACDVSPNGQRLVTAITHLRDRSDESPEARLFTSQSGEVRLWDLASGQAEGAPIKVPAEPRDVRFRPDGMEVAVVCAGRQVLIFDSGSGQLKKTFYPKPFKLPATFHVGNHQLLYSRDGQRLYVYGPGGCGLEVLDAETGKSLFKSGLEVFDVRESSDGSIVAVAYGRNNLQVQQFDTRTFQEVAPPIQHPDWVFGVRFDQRGDRLLTSCRDRAARLWERTSGRLLSVFSHENEVVSAELFGGDRFVVSVGHDEVARLSDVATGRPVAPPIKLGGLGLSTALSGNGRWALLGGFTTSLTVLDLESITRPADGTAEQLVRRAELLAGRRIDAHGSVVNLTADEWKDHWEEYRRSLPRDN